MGDSQDILFIGDLSVCIPFTSSSLMVSNFALCGIPFLAGFYSRDFISEMFSIRYINIFGFLFGSECPTRYRTRGNSLPNPAFL